MGWIRSKGDRYALSALRNRRAILASEIIQLERQLRARKVTLEHVDATLRLLDPSIELDSIPNKRLMPKRIRLFRQGELGRLILGALRQADGTPLSTAQVATVVIKAGGHGEGARKAVGQRVRGNLAYPERRGKITKEGTGKGARWALS